jgi:hypothetical protein
MFQSHLTSKTAVARLDRALPSLLRTRLIAAALALGGVTGAAMAAGVPGPGEIQYLHEPQLAANNCIALEQQNRAAQHTAVLVNHCSYDVSVSYCVDGTEDCQTGQAATRHVAAGASLAVDDSLGLGGSEINWVACREAGNDVVSSLDSDRGQLNGDCLEPAAQAAVAAQQP